MTSQQRRASRVCTATCTTATVATTASLVHPGSFCSTSGAQGVTIQETLMMRKEGVNDGRLRWRKVR